MENTVSTILLSLYVLSLVVFTIPFVVTTNGTDSIETLTTQVATVGLCCS